MAVCPATGGRCEEAAEEIEEVLAVGDSGVIEGCVTSKEGGQEVEEILAVEGATGVPVAWAGRPTKAGGALGGVALVGATARRAVGRGNDVAGAIGHAASAGGLGASADAAGGALALEDA